MTLAQVLLDETGTEMNVDLHERRVTDALEAVDLARLDDENVSRARFARKAFITEDTENRRKHRNYRKGF